MGKVFVDGGISLDGFIAGLNGGDNNPLGDNGLKIHEWVFKQKTFLKHLKLPGDGETGIDNDLVERLSIESVQTLWVKGCLLKARQIGPRKHHSIVLYMF